MKRLLITSAITSVIAIIWTVALVVVYGKVVRVNERDTEQIALTQAKTLFQQVVDVRSWNASHGGVYVKVNGGIQPNPYLEVPDRDLILENGQKLTLVNPAFMTRQLAEIGLERHDLLIHITSLKPIRPANGPTLWEETALKSFEDGADQQAEFAWDADGRQRYRYMKPLMVEQACLKCHSRQGYRTGDIRGGISVSFPVDNLFRSMVAYRAQSRIVLGIIWVLGLAVLGTVTLYFREKQKQVEEFRNLALVDDLTGLNNRRAFFALAHQQMEWAERFSEKALVVFFDLDGMKQINDNFGHDEGDSALVSVAEALLESFRGSDIVARYAGDEFVAFLPKSSLAFWEMIAQRVLENVRKRNESIIKGYSLSISIGVAQFDPDTPESLEYLIKEADRSMYSVKQGESD